MWPQEIQREFVFTLLLTATIARPRKWRYDAGHRPFSGPDTLKKPLQTADSPIGSVLRAEALQEPLVKTSTSGRIAAVLVMVLFAGLARLDGARQAPGAALEQMPPAAGPVLGRNGYDVTAPFFEIAPDAKGARRVHVAPSDRMELSFGTAVAAGYLIANGEARALPIGSHLDPSSGTFTWVPPVGYFGTYALAFVINDGRVDVNVSVRPDAPVTTCDVYVDEIAATFGRAHTISGWAFDPDAFTGSGVSAVHVWAVRRDGDRTALFLGAAALGLDRADAPAPDTGALTGFSLDTASLRGGDYDIYVFAWNDRARAWMNARVVPITVR